MLTTNKNKEMKSEIFDIELLLSIYSPSFISSFTWGFFEFPCF